MEEAGGLASTGRQRILDVPPTSLHQRVPLVFGSRREVETVERYHQEHDETGGAAGAKGAISGLNGTGSHSGPGSGDDRAPSSGTKRPERFDASLFNARTLFRS